MRNPRPPAWARSAVFAATLMLGAAAFAPGAAAEEKFQRLFVFGDSYADLTLSDQPASNPLASPGAPPGFGLSLWRVYPIPLGANLGVPEIVDIAVGGATASPTAASPSPLITDPKIAPGNLPRQVAGFLAENPSLSFGARDLVTINIGGNDIRAILGNSPAGNKAAGYPEALINKDNAKDFAAQTTDYAVNDGIKPLVDAGARNFVLGGFSSISGLPELQKQLDEIKKLEDLKLVPPGTAKSIADSADAFAGAYFTGLQTQLLPLAQAGTRFFLFDLGRLGAAVLENPGKYGFAGGFVCPANGVFFAPDPRAGICGATVTNPTNKNDLQTQFYFGPDGLHLTNGGFKLVADYMANIVMAPDTIAVQPGIVSTTTGGFVDSLFGRLGGVRHAMQVSGDLASAADAPMGLGHTQRAHAVPPSRLTGYTMGTFLGGSRDDRPDVVGLEYDSTSGTAGIEYSVSRNLIVGLAGNYSTTHADLASDANIDLDAIQAAAYVSYATRQVFADAIAAFGSHDVGLRRPGEIDDIIRSDTEATAFALAARGGYLFDFGSLRAGPIAGLTYIRARVDGYGENGDDLLTFNVSEQTLDSLAGNVGIRFLAPFRTTGGSIVVPYLNVMLEHQFGDGTRTLTASLAQAPLLPILTSFPNFDTRTYGRIEGGVSVEFAPGLSATVSAGSTFARDESNDFRISTGLSYRF